MGTFSIAFRVTLQPTDLSPLLQFWTRISGSPQSFPCTPADKLVCTTTILRSIQCPLSFLAKVYYRSYGQAAKTEMEPLIAAAFLASQLTAAEFNQAVVNLTDRLFPQEWAITRNLFRPVIGEIQEIFVRAGPTALFINALLVDANLTHSDAGKVCLKLYRRMMTHAVHHALKRGIRVMLFVAKDYNEVQVFSSLGFQVLHDMPISWYARVTLMVWTAASVNKALGVKYEGPMNQANGHC